MLEKAFSGNRSYFGWITVLLIMVGIGFYNYLKQLNFGLGITA